MSREFVVGRIVTHTKCGEDQADKAIDAALSAFGCMLHGRPPPADCPVRPGELIRSMRNAAGISEQQAGRILALIVSEISHLAHANGVRSVLEFRDEEV